MIDDLPGDERAKRDRTARLLMVVQILRANGTRGVTPAEIAKRTGMAKRTVYRDLNAIEGEIGIAVWCRRPALGPFGRRIPAAAQADARRGDGRRPLGPADGPLRRQVRPGPRGGVREARADPARGPRRARRPDARRPLAPPDRRALQPPRSPAHEGLGGASDRRRSTTSPRTSVRVRAADRPRPAVPHRAIAPDPRALSRRVRRDARRDPDVQDRADPRRVADARIVRRPGARDGRGDVRAGLGHHRRPGRRPRSCSASRRRSPLASRRRTGTPRNGSRSRRDGSLLWRATVAGTIEIRLWVLSWGADVEVLAPATLRDDVAATAERALARYRSNP